MRLLMSRELKERLIGRGLWSDFVRMREERSISPENKGKRVRDITDEILSEIAPDLKGLLDVKSVSESAKDRTSDRKLRSRMKRAASNGTVSVCDVSGDVKSSMFDGKKCSPYAAFMWAYPKLCIGDVDPNDAPSMFAWQLYCDMKTNQSLRNDMIKGVLVAAVKKSEETTDAMNRFDGEYEYDLLGAISSAGGA